MKNNLPPVRERIRVSFKPGDSRYVDFIGACVACFDVKRDDLHSFEVVPMQHSGFMIIYLVIDSSIVDTWRVVARDAGADAFDIHDGSPGPVFRPQPK